MENFDRTTMSAYEEVMQKGGFNDSEYTILTRANRMEKHAKGCLINMACSLLHKGIRKVGAVREVVRFVDWGIPGDVPNFELLVESFDYPGNIIRVVMTDVRLIFHDDVERALEVADEENGLDPKDRQRARDKEFLEKLAKWR
jgi:hypothetical protein